MRMAYRTAGQTMTAFSRDVIRLPLYSYQAQWADYIMNVACNHRTETIGVEMCRQSGKNEGSAQIEVGLLARMGQAGGGMVKCAPTAVPQVVTSKERFQSRAEMAQRRLPFFKVRSSYGYLKRFRQASIAFFSAAPTANVVSATASLLMEVDEAQDVSPEKFDKDFSPMRASTGAPVVAYGTTWTDDSLLERFKREVEDGRVAGRWFRVLPDEVAASNPAYGAFVDGEIGRLGRDHPLVKTQYFLEPLPNRGRLLSLHQLLMMRGQHRRKEARTDEPVIVAGLDFAGADETGDELASIVAASARDSVALVVGAVEWVELAKGVRVPRVRVLARYEWVNVHPLSLHATLYEILQERWRVNLVHCDATGVGSTGTAMLAKAIDAGEDLRVHPVKFDSQWGTQTDLATGYIAMVNRGHFQDYAVDAFDVTQAAQHDAPDVQDVDKHMWWQRGHARLEAKPSKKYRAYVPESQGHDDLLVAEMLMVDAANAMTAATDSVVHYRPPFGKVDERRHKPKMIEEMEKWQRRSKRRGPFG